MNNLKEKIGSVYNTFVLHWKTPPLGKYVAFKEVFSYGIGGLGQQFVIAFSSLIGLSATSFLVGNTIGIKPMDLQLMSILSTFIGFVITLVRSYLIDGVRLKMGKYRPWILTTGIPTIIISVVFVWLPYETMSYMQKSVAVFVCFNLLQFFFPFYKQAYTDLANVISPNSHERTDIVSISSIIYSLAPTLTGLFIPMMSTLTGGLNDIRTYRIIHPIVAIVGLLLSSFAVFGTKERIVVAKTHINNFKFMDALRSVAKNKYFWITSLAGWLGFLESAVGVIIGWTFIYGYPEKMALYGIATTLIGNASLWSMIICPIAIRTIGKRNLLIWCNLMNVVVIGLLYPFYNNLVMLIVLYYLNGFATNFAIVYTPGISADIRDYQQWYTGERIDGMFGAVGIIGSFIGMFTGLVVPAIYQQLGLKDNYDVLEVASVRQDLCEVLIIAATLGAALNVVPYFFYDLTESKQKGIVKVLKIRALFEDFGNGVLKDEKLVEAIELIDEANEFNIKRQTITTKDDIKKAKLMPKRNEQEIAARNEAIAKAKAGYKATVKAQKDEAKARIATAKSKPENERKAALKAARKENRAIKKLNEEISVCDFVIDEMNKFSTLRFQKKVERAEQLIALGESGIRNADKSVLRDAKNMPKTSHEERELRNDAITEARLLLSCKKSLLKYYPNGIVIPNTQELIDAAELPEDSFKAKAHKKKLIKKLVDEKSKFNKSYKSMLDAERLLKEKENFLHLDDIRAKYNEAKLAVNKRNEEKKQEIALMEQKRKEDIERRKQERAAKRNKGGK